MSVRGRESPSIRPSDIGSLRVCARFDGCQAAEHLTGVCEVHYRRQLDERKSAEDPEYRIKRHLWGRYKMTIEQYDELFERQGGVCAICRVPAAEAAKDNRKLCVDHDHSCCPGQRSCGKCVRGLLCNHCNPKLWVLEGNPEWRASAELYLNERSIA